MDGHGREYWRRQPEQTVLYEAVRQNLATFLEEASQQGQRLLRYVERDFTRYLECRVLAHGFARVRCENCKDELPSPSRARDEGCVPPATRSGCM